MLDALPTRSLPALVVLMEAVAMAVAMAVYVMWQMKSDVDCLSLIVIVIIIISQPSLLLAALLSAILQWVTHRHLSWAKSFIRLVVLAAELLSGRWLTHPFLLGCCS
jgi:hypothetical protein